MILYRVQNEKGWGPYGCSMSGMTSHDWADPEDPAHNSKPCPQEDGLDRIEHDWICGFVTLSDLKRWFSKTELVRLAALGMHVYEIDVEEYFDETRYRPRSKNIQYGFSQAIFAMEAINHEDLHILSKGRF
jgi:hypothetical protein